MLNKSGQAGLSLVELMVGLVVGLVVVAGAGAMYMTTARGQTYALRGAKLNQELRATMNVIAADVRRAGYWAGSVIPGTLPTFPPNPYMLRDATQTDITVLSGGTCIMYSYDADGDGANLAAETNQEVFGFRLTNGGVQMLSDVIASTANCAAGTWGALTSTDTIIVDSLQFSTTNSQCLNATKALSWRVTAANSRLAPCSAPAAAVTMNEPGQVFAAPTAGDRLTEVRQVRITLTGRHQSDPTMASTVVETVHLGNNRIFTAP